MPRMRFTMMLDGDKRVIEADYDRRTVAVAWDRTMSAGWNGTHAQEMMLEAERRLWPKSFGPNRTIHTRP